MAFTSTERAQLMVHLRALHVLCPDSWLGEVAPGDALDDATAEQEAAARASLTTLERLSTGIQTMDSRLSVKELVGEVVLRDDEHDLRIQQYEMQLKMLGLLFELIDPQGGGYAIASETQRSVL